MNSLFQMWWRELLHLKHDFGRWLGVVLHPLLFWVLLGTGFANSFSIGGQSAEDYLHYAFPGMIIMIVMFTGSFTAMSAITDRKEGLLMALFAGPDHPAMLGLGKTLGVSSIVLVQCLLVVPLAAFCGYSLTLFNVLRAVGVLSLFVLSFSAVNIAIAWKLSSAYAYHGLIAILWLPLWLSSGAVFPPNTAWMQRWSVINPFSHVIFSLRYALGANQVGDMPSSMQALSRLLIVFIISLAILLYVTRRIPRRVH